MEKVAAYCLFRFSPLAPVSADGESETLAVLLRGTNHGSNGFPDSVLRYVTEDVMSCRAGVAVRLEPQRHEPS